MPRTSARTRSPSDEASLDSLTVSAELLTAAAGGLRAVSSLH